MVRCANRYIIAYLFYNTKQMNSESMPLNYFHFLTKKVAKIIGQFKIFS